MKYIVAIKDEQNEISIAFDDAYKVTDLIKTFLQSTEYSIEIMKITEE